MSIASDHPVASLLPSNALAEQVVIEGLSDLQVWSLWVPITTPIPSVSVRWLLNGTLALWHVGSGGTRSEAARAKGRAFGVGSKVADRVVSMVTIALDEQEIFSDVAVASQSEVEIAAFLSRPMAPLDSAAAIFPSLDKPEAIADWTSATLPLLSLWIGQAKGAIGGRHESPLVIAFINQSLECGAVPMLQLRDASGDRVLLLLGDQALLREVSRGVNVTTELNPTLASRASRGLRMPLAP
jgi:hypothetical protein